MIDNGDWREWGLERIGIRAEDESEGMSRVEGKGYEESWSYFVCKPFLWVVDCLQVLQVHSTMGMGMGMNRTDR